MNIRCAMSGGRASALTLILLVVLARIFALSLGGHDLYGDEAQYWEWAQHPAFGYYSKPPMVAWLITASTWICGNDSEFCVRLSSPIVHGAVAWMVYLLAERLFSSPIIAFWSAACYLFLPAVVLSSTIISTDPPLLFFWAASIYTGLRAIETDRLGWWLVFGTAVGLGCLSKYNMAIIAPSLALYLLVSGRYRFTALLKNPKLWLAVGVATLIYLPNLWWNYQHGFVSYRHTKDISKLDRKLFNPRGLAEFLAGQIAVFGPFMCAGLIWAFIRIRKLWAQESYRMLFCFFLPFFLMISTLSLLSGAQANWAAPAYISATLMVAAAAVEYRKTWLLGASLALHLLLSLVFYNYHPLMAKLGVTLRAESGPVLARDPFHRVRGWRELGKEVSGRLSKMPGAILMTDERKLLVDLIYYVQPHPFNALKWNYRDGIHDHYDLTRSFEQHKIEVGERVILFITRNPLDEGIKATFAHIEKLPDITIPLYPDFALNYSVYRLQGTKE